MPPSAVLNTALPLIGKVDDCASFEKGVAPYLHQLVEFPQRLLTTTSISGLQQTYMSTNPAMTAIFLSVVVAQIAFVVSTINKNYSQIDRVWSILPAVYNCHYWFYGYLHGIRAQRLDVIAMFSLCWSARLTYNYWRKGGYQKGSEDYRWEFVKGWFNEPSWVVFNYIVVSLFQSVLLALVTTPVYLILLMSRIEPASYGADGAFPQVLGALLVLEFYSDNQQWEFHKAKKSYQKTAKVPLGFTAGELDRGFCATGLWSYSRHPNFAAEQGIWIAMYQWACFQTNSMINCTFIGPILYLAIFQVSTPLTEHITSGKYPEYKAYKQHVSRFIPRLLGPKWQDYTDKLDKKKETAAAKTTEGAEKTKGFKRLR